MASIYKIQKDTSTTNIELFQVRTRVAKYGDYLGVDFNWFIYERKEPLQIDMASVVNNYDAIPEHCGGYVETAVNEYFTESEAQALFAYIVRRHGATSDDTKIEKVQLPVPNNIMGFQCIAAGVGEQDWYQLWKEEDYSLPFKAEAFFDLRFSEYAGPLCADVVLDDRGEIPF